MQSFLIFSLPIILCNAGILMGNGEGYDDGAFIEISANDLVMLVDWVPTEDWDSDHQSFHANISIGKKKYLYSSQIPTETSIYDPMGLDTIERGMQEYALSVMTTDWLNPEDKPVDPGVPGPFSYSEGFDRWGGDDVYGTGGARYALLQNNFDHNRIAALQHRNYITRQRGGVYDTLASLKMVDMTLDRLSEGSVLALGRFADVVDIKGNMKNTTEGSNISRKLRHVFRILLFGCEDRFEGGFECDVSGIFGLFYYFFENIIVHHTISITQKNLLFELMVNWEVDFGIDIEKYNVYQRTLFPLNTLLQGYQHHASIGYENYVSYFAGRLHEDTIREYYFKGLWYGQQFGVFYRMIYTITNILDVLYYSENADDYSIRPDIRMQRLYRINSDSYKYWLQYVTMIDDYNKASVLNNQEEMFRINTQLTETCSNIASTLGEVFRAIDHLTRERKLYEEFTDFLVYY